MSRTRESLSGLEEGRVTSEVLGEVSGIQVKRGRQKPNLRLTLPKRITPETSSSAVHFSEDVSEWRLRTEGSLSRAEESEPGHEPKTGDIRKDIDKILLSKKQCKIPVPDVSWIVNNLTRTRLKPVIRCAIAAWLAMLLVLIKSTQRVLGQVVIMYSQESRLTYEHKG